MKLSPAQKDELQSLVDGQCGGIIKENVAAALLKRGYIAATDDPKDQMCIMLGASRIEITEAGRAALEASKRRT